MADYARWTSKLKALIKHFTYRLAQLQTGSLVSIVKDSKSISCRLAINANLDVEWNSLPVRRIATFKCFLSRSQLQGDECRGRLPIQSIKFIRIGQRTSAFKQARDISQYDSLSFSLVYGADFNTLDIISDNDDDFQNWMVTLQALVHGAADSQVRHSCIVTIVIISTTGADEGGDPRRID